MHISHVNTTSHFVFNMLSFDNNNKMQDSLNYQLLKGFIAASQLTIVTNVLFTYVYHHGKKYLRKKAHDLFHKGSKLNKKKKKNKFQTGSLTTKQKFPNLMQ